MCATKRGHLFLKTLLELSNEDEIIVFCFKEEPWEPAYIDDIKRQTLEASGTFFETKNPGGKKWDSFWNSADIDLILVVSWRYMIPPSVYNKARYGTFVFHDSLLPKYRGFSPTVWAIINGENQTGVTLFEIAEKVDEGDIIDQIAIPIHPEDTISNVIENVTEGYLNLLKRNYIKLIDGSAFRIPQNHLNATYTCKLTPEDFEINWTENSRKIFNLIRAVSKPYPGAYTFLNGKKIKIWGARLLIDFPNYVGRIPGRVAECRPGQGTVVLTGDSAMLLSEVQFENSPNTLCASKVLNKPNQTLGR